MLLEVNDLSVHYGAIPALNNISFFVREGKIVSLIGANGAGKTTALQTISGLLRCTCGRISFGGTDITKYPAHKIVRLGLVQTPEGRGIFPNLTVLENMKLGSYLRKDKKAVSTDFERVLDLFPQLSDRKKQLAGTLSGGELQMLALARALLMKPTLVMFDEPSMGLAPKLVEEIFDVIVRLNAENSMTVLLVEQNAFKALEISDRTYVLETGVIVNSGLSSELMCDEAIKRAYLGI